MTQLDNVVFLPLRQLSELIKARQVSPVEVTRVFLDRLERLGPQYNSVVTLTTERAMRQALQAEQEIAAGHYRGFLHGIPYGAKDLLATSDGIPTTWGAAPLRNQVFNYNATVISKLEEAGAVLAAKLAMIELAGGMGYRQPNASFTGPVSTPWSKNAWSGGSSSGSGASVAAGLVPFAIGSETWGSILSPANNCGIAGLRPTYGRVSRYGAMALSWTLDKLGPLCLTADDCGLVLSSIAGQDPNDLSTSPRSYTYQDQVIKSDQFKFGVIKGVTDGTQEDVAKNFEQSMKVLEKIGTIEEVSFPDLPYEAVTRTILMAESAAAFDEFIDAGQTGELTAPEDRYGGYARMAILATDYLRALRIRTQMARAADDVLARYDALIAPTRATAAPAIEGDFRGVLSGNARDLMGAIGNGAGLPAVSVPNGFTEDGLPTGIQFMGRAYEENIILAAAKTYQTLTEWHTQHPKSLV
ncbi:MAG: amidase [Chloroflexota bacterium]|nr:amidase [Chloroflexota bacterium]